MKFHLLAVRPVQAVYYREFGDADVLEIGARPVPVPGPDQVLVKVAAAGVNPIDRRLRAGELERFFKRTWPIVPGWDFAGTIASVGAEVGGWQPGDEVLGLAFSWALGAGTYAEYVPVAAGAIAARPAELDVFEAAAIPLVSLTAWQALVEFGRLARGQSVLIQAGAGGVGSIAIPIAKYLGARVYTTASARNLDYVRRLGADIAIDHMSENYIQVVGLHEPEGLHLVLESLEDETAIRAAPTLVRDGGAVVYLNNEPPDLPDFRERQIRSEFLHHRADGAMLAEIVTLIARGALPRPTVEVLPLEEAAEAHRRLASWRTVGKLVLDVTGGEGTPASGTGTVR